MWKYGKKSIINFNPMNHKVRTISAVIKIMDNLNNTDNLLYKLHKYHLMNNV